jgi:surface antigen/LysM repeat protein
LIGGHSRRFLRHVWVLGLAAVLAFVVTQPRTAAGSGPLTLNHIAAVQIDAVIQKPATAPLMASRPAQTVVVHAGQSVTSLATEYGSNAAAIRWANGIAGGAEPTSGTALLLPPGQGALVHVQAGETPTAFAERLHLDPSLVLDYNNLSTNDPLPPGTYLQVPYGAAPSGALIADRFQVAQPGVPMVAEDHGSDTFPYGQCTYYVASRRDVTWGGNAWVWYAAASGIRPEGHVPVVGSIVVFGVGWAGHVAYVEHVNPDGSFLVSEMNYYGNGGGWGLVDRRTISANDGTILGFIY